MTFRCQSPYQMNGSDTVTCVNSRWIGQPVCKDNSCVDPPHVPNATIVTRTKNKYLHGDRVRYECNKPLELFGQVEVMCEMGYGQKNQSAETQQGNVGLLHLLTMETSPPCHYQYMNHYHQLNINARSIISLRERRQ